MAKKKEQAPQEAVIEELKKTESGGYEFRPIGSPQKDLTLSDLKGIKISRALLHQACPIANVVETTLSDTRVRGLNMLYTTSGLVLELKGKRQIVPLANVITCFE